MNSLDGILKLADNELDQMVNSGKFRSRDDVDIVYKLVDIVKDVHCIWAYEEDEGYSENYGENSYRGGRSNRGRSNEGRSYEGRSYEGGSYEGGRSYARGRSNRGGRMSRNSYRGGCSRDSKQEYVEELRELMEDAPDDETRQNIQRMIQQMEQQM